jgi:hypothetical protein
MKSAHPPFLQPPFAAFSLEQPVALNYQRKTRRRTGPFGEQCSAADLDGTNPPAVAGMDAATDDVAAPIIIVVVVRVGIVSVVVGSKAKPYKRSPVKSVVKSSTLEPTPSEASAKAAAVEPTASEASMKATSTKAASAKATTVEATSSTAVETAASAKASSVATTTTTATS